MNDAGEYKNGFQIIQDVLSEYSDVDDSVATLMSPENLNSTFRVLIACFSIDGDVRSQWIAYADDGQGFSIGFDSDLIERNNMFNRYLEKMQPISSMIKFIGVNYDRKIFEQEVRRMIESCKDSKSPIKFKLLARLLMQLAIRYKDKFFEEEREIRGFIAPENEIVTDDFYIECRSNGYGEVYFHQLNTSYKNFNAIKEIIIGPKNPLKIDEIKTNLINVGLRDVAINYSRGREKYR